MDILQVKKELADRAKQVAAHLLPHGVESGHEWRVGSVGGEKGQSLGVHLTGVKAGVWADFNTGEGGDLLDLWSQTQRVTLGEALNLARNWLGVARPAPAFQPKRRYVRPPKPKCAAPQARVKDYLTEIRNIPGHVVDAYKVGEQGEDIIIFPFLLPSGELAMAKARKAEDGARPKPTASDCEPILFGWQAVPANAREIAITEGEIDALSLAAYGWPALSVPFGGGGGNKQQWIENEFENLERFEKIYLALDMDKPGEEASAEIAARLGRHRCYRVKLPLKDANACLMEGIGKDVIDAAMRGAVSLDPDGLRKPMEYADAVIGLFWPTDGQPIGYRTPYRSLGSKLLFRPAEMTLWSGASGAGKSQILSDCSVDWLNQNSRICISSLEMKAASSLKRMCKQVIGVERPTAPYIRAALTWMSNGLLMYDLVGKASVEALLEVFDYARAKYGCDQFIVDSLMRLGIASDDYTGQEKAIFRLVEWTISSNIHLHVVAHARKGGPQGGAPETEDIKGAMEIGANAFNILTVWRNRKLEDDVRRLDMKINRGKDEDAELEKLKSEPGVVLNVAKQRNGDFEGKVGLWFDTASYRYRSRDDGGFTARAKYVEKSHEIVEEFGDAHP